MRREENQLDATEWFIALIICSTCFGHLYAHHQELETIPVLLPHMACNALLLVVVDQVQGSRLCLQHNTCCSTDWRLVHFVANIINPSNSILCVSLLRKTTNKAPTSFDHHGGYLQDEQLQYLLLLSYIRYKNFKLICAQHKQNFIDCASCKICQICYLHAQLIRCSVICL